MIYLIGQIFFCLALVGMVGLLVGWLVRGIGTHQKEKELEATWRMRLRQRDSMLSKMANELADRRDPSNTAPRPVASDAQVTKELDELRRIARDRNTQLAQLQGKVSKRDAQISQLFAEIRRIGGQPAVDKLLGQVNSGDFLDSGMHRLSELMQKPPPVAGSPPPAPAVESQLADAEDDPSERTHPEKISLQRASEPRDSTAAKKIPDVKPVEKKPVEKKPVDKEPVDGKPGEGEPDELAFIYGISPALEKKLLKIGITRYRQIAAFTDGDIKRTAKAVGIEAEQIEEENWVEGARQEHLAKYGEIV